MAFVCTIVCTVELAFKNGCCQCLCLQGKLQLCSASLGESLKPEDESNQDSFQITASALGSRACEILCAYFKSRIFVYDSPLDLLKASPDGLQN